jgi:NTE family protein
MAPLDPDSSQADFLSAVPILAGLSEDLRAEIASRSKSVEVPAGAWLFRQGDPGGSLYVVRSGRLEVVVEMPESEVVRVLNRGAVVGELALLMESPRSASVRARRDSELLELTRPQFAELLTTEPEFALALTRELGRELQDSRALIPPRRPIPTTISLLAEPSALMQEVCDGLLSGMRKFGSVAQIEDPGEGADAADYGPLLDGAERTHRQILLAAGPPTEGEGWMEFCLRQSDRVVVLASEGEVPPWIARYPRLAGCDLLLHGASARQVDAGRWCEALRPRTTHLLRAGPDFAGDIGRAARRLAGRAVGVVLSGGGARGFAHIGVLEELLASGMTIDRVGGCSMGAFVGAMFAMEHDPEAIRVRCREEFVLRSPLNDYTIPLVSLVRGQRARATLMRTFGSNTIETLPRDYFAVSCDLVSGDLVVNRDGPLFEAVGMSMCLPGVFAPMPRGDHLLVDGGVLNNLPVEPMAVMAEGPIIAVDVTAQFLPPEARVPRRRRPRARDWSSRARRAVVGVDTPLPSLKETLTRAIGIGSVYAVELARRRADLLITPETGVVDLLDFQQIDRMVELGRQAARTALDAAPGFPGD